MRKRLLMALSLCLCTVCSGCLILGPTDKPQYIYTDAYRYTYSEAENEPTVYITAPDGTRYVRDYYTAAICLVAEAIFEKDGEDAIIGYCPEYKNKYIYETTNKDCICLRDPHGECVYFYREGYELPEFNNETIDKVVIFPEGKDNVEIDISNNNELKTEIINTIRENAFAEGIPGGDLPLRSQITIFFYDNESGIYTGKTISIDAEGIYYFSYNHVYKSNTYNKVSVYVRTKEVECPSELIEMLKSYGFLD